MRYERCVKRGLLTGVIVFVAAAPVFGGFVEIDRLADPNASVSFGATNPGPNSEAGQTFTVPTSGILETVQVSIGQGQLPEGPEPVLVDFYAATGGVPDVLLGSAAIPPTASSFDYQLMSADFLSQDIGLIGGKSYTFMLHVTTPGSPAYFASVNFGDNYYPGGGLVQSPDGSAFSLTSSAYTINFELTAVPVPEPASCASLVSGVAVVLLRQLQRGKRERG